MKFIKLKDVTIRAESVVAYGEMKIPQTLQTPEFFALSVWLKDGKEPIVATYESEEERDADMEALNNEFTEKVS